MQRLRQPPRQPASILSPTAWYALGAAGLAGAGAYGIYRALSTGPQKVQLLEFQGGEAPDVQDFTVLFFHSRPLNERLGGLTIDKHDFIVPRGSNVESLTKTAKESIGTYIKTQLATELGKWKTGPRGLVLNFNLTQSGEKNYLAEPYIDVSPSAEQIKIFSDFVLEEAKAITGWAGPPKEYHPKHSTSDASKTYIENEDNF